MLLAEIISVGRAGGVIGFLDEVLIIWRLYSRIAGFCCSMKESLTLFKQRTPLESKKRRSPVKLEESTLAIGSREESLGLTTRLFGRVF